MAKVVKQLCSGENLTHDHKANALLQCHCATWSGMALLQIQDGIRRHVGFSVNAGIDKSW